MEVHRWTVSFRNVPIPTRKLSIVYLHSEIVIEEWKFITSDEPFVSGLYKGKVTTIPATRKEVHVA